MKGLQVLGVVAIIIVVIAVLARSSDWELVTYKDKNEHFTIDLPEGWKPRFLGPSAQADTAYAVIANKPFDPTRPEEGQRYADGILIKVERLGPDWTLASYMEASERFWVETFRGFEEIDRGDTTLDGQPARWMQYTYQELSEDRSVDLTVGVIVYVMLTDGRGFTITCELVTDQMDQSGDQLRLVADSLRVEEAAASGE